MLPPVEVSVADYAPLINAKQLLIHTKYTSLSQKPNDSSRKAMEPVVALFRASYDLIMWGGWHERNVTDDE